MSTGSRIVRIVTGTLLVSAILVATILLLSRWTPTWGATEAKHAAVTKSGRSTTEGTVYQRSVSNV